MYLKREDLQVVRSYKLRGAYNKIASLDADQRQRGVVCASAGNHAQGFAFSCNNQGIKGVVFMPRITPKQKIRQTRVWGGGSVEIVLTGDTFDDCAAEARRFCDTRGMTFVHPFDDPRIIEGQGTVGLEILEDLKQPDYVFLPIGGGGLAAGVGSVLQSRAPGTNVVGVEPLGAPSMLAALQAGEPVRLDQIDPFVDGAAVKRVGDITFDICRRVLTRMATVPEGAVCTTLLDLYNQEGMVVEPAGALSVAALSEFADEIRGRSVVCVISGSNADVDRLAEVKERSLVYQGLKHYFLIKFAQRPGALKEFVSSVLGPGDDITRFEYLKKDLRENGPALVGVELGTKGDYDKLINAMRLRGIDFTEISRSKDEKLAAFLL